MKTKELLTEHFNRYPKAELQDIFKFIHQSSFGCEHMVSSLERATEYIKSEYAEGVADADILPLDGEYSRVPLCYINKGLSAETFGKLFYLSAERVDGRAELLAKLEVLRELTGGDELDKAINEWEQKGFPALHHSHSFREEYKPAYRVIKNKFIPFLPLLCEIDKRLREGNVILSVEGSSASGKSTLADILGSVYDCNIIHTDDFFLQMHQRTPERFKEVGGNLDRERFYTEVVAPLKDGKEFTYRKFDCSKLSLGESATVTPKPLTVVEGAYSMHPYFGEYYDLSAFIDIDPELQRERILKRNPNMADRFFNEWIPLEKTYFESTRIPEKCDIVISVN
ncbi:MAG: hypothetical protein IKT46_07015 [Clostridia bacterium]|nr:hypothetical protein [Clostridia bacterium]